MPDDVHSLLETLRSESASAEERAAAAKALCHMGEDARAAAVALACACADPAEKVREWSTAALEELGPPEEADVPKIAGLLKEQNADTAYWAATLLGRLGQDAAAAAASLGEALQQHGETSVRERAAWALGQIGIEARAALPSLEQAAGSGSPRLERLARKAIINIRGER